MHYEHGWPWVFYHRTVEETSDKETDANMDSQMPPVLKIANWRIWQGSNEEPLKAQLLLADVALVGFAATIAGVLSEIRTRYRGGFFRLSVTDGLLVFVVLVSVFGYWTHCKIRKTNEDKLVVKLESKGAFAEDSNVRWMLILFGYTPDIFSHASYIDLLDVCDSDMPEVAALCSRVDGPLTILCNDTEVALSSLKSVAGLQTLVLYWKIKQPDPSYDRFHSKIIPLLVDLKQVSIIDLRYYTKSAEDVDALRRSRPLAKIID